MVEIQSIEGGVKFVFQDNTFYLQNGTIQYPLNALAMIIDESNAVTFRLPNNDIALSVKLSELGKTKAEMEALYAEAFVGDSGMAPEDVEELIDERVTPIEEELDALDGVVTAHTGNSEIHVTAQDKQNWNNKADQSDIEGLQQQINTKADQSSVVSLQNTVTAHTSDTNVHVTAQEKQDWNGKASQASVDALQATVTAHTSNSEIHVTAQDKQNWDAKADASDIADIEAELANKADKADLDALDAQLEGKADATDVESQFEVAAIAMTKLDEEKADIADLDAIATQLEGKADQATVTAHTSNSEIHVTAQDKQNWDAKADASDIADIEAELATKADQSDIAGLQAQIDVKEEVISTALNDLNEGKLDVSAYTPTDLSNYYTKSETDTALANKANTATTYTKSEVDSLIQSLESAIASQLGGLSFVELTQAEYDALTTKQPHTVYIING